MNAVKFAGCCTATILTGFGQTNLGEEYFRPEEWAPTVKDIKEQLISHIEFNKRYGDAMITCITNNEQVNANQALEECGFSYSYWMSKAQHPETQVKLWWFPLNDKQING